MRHLKFLAAFAALVIACGSGISKADTTKRVDEPLALVVMDPLAAPLSCPCVKGYAQRKYEVLGAHLESSLDRKVEVVHAQSLAEALRKTQGRADIVIGKRSVVQSDLADAKINATPMYRLTDQQGKTTQHGLIVVNADDPAQRVDDLKGYTIIFGPSEAEEKSAAVLALLDKANVQIEDSNQKVNQACSDGACEVIDLGPDSKTAAVISSYAKPLLEGCGTIKKGALRVVARTAPVPFVTLFVNESLSDSQAKILYEAVQAVSVKPDVLDALESLIGFVPATEVVNEKKK